MCKEIEEPGAIFKRRLIFMLVLMQGLLMMLMPGLADADARAGVNLEILRRGGACRRQQSANPATLQMAILRSWLLADLGSTLSAKQVFQ